MARSESDSCVVVKLHRFYLSWFLHSLLSSPAVLDSDGQTVRICLPLDKSKTINYCNKYHQTKQIDTYFPCTCKMIWLKREVGYKNVSLFGKLSRFSWNYGGLCSNFAPNSLSIEGRYGYAAVPHKERQDQSSVLSRKAGGRKEEGWRYDGPLYQSLSHLRYANIRLLLAEIQEAAIMMVWMGGRVSAFTRLVCCFCLYIYIYILIWCVLVCREAQS